jgi:predicted RNase H-like HicB family nuclease
MTKYVSSQKALAAKYPFAAIPNPDGDGWAIVFPDIAGVVGFTETWNEIGNEAQTILALWIATSAEDNHPIPAPSPDWDPIEREPGAYKLPELYSSDDVGEMLGISSRRVPALAKSRHLGQLVGNSLVFTLEEVDAMRDRRPGRPKKHPVTARDLSRRRRQNESRSSWPGFVCLQR